MSFKDYFESTRIAAEGSDCRSSLDRITGISGNHFINDYPVQIESIGRRFPDNYPLLPPPDRFPTDYSGGWWDFGHANHYINLNEPVPSYGINSRDLLYGAAGVAAGFLKIPTPAGLAISVLHFVGGVAMTLSDFSRTGFVDLGSLAIP
jgi:hypothetical protein